MNEPFVRREGDHLVIVMRGDDGHWREYRMDMETAINHSARLRTLAEGENHGPLERRGA